MQPFERVAQKLLSCKNEVSCSYVAQNVDWRKFWPKSVVAKTVIFIPCSLRASVGRKINILYKFIGFFQSHLKNNRFCNIISLLLADFSRNFVTRLLAESSSFLRHHLADLGHNYLATLAVSTCTECHVTMRTG